MITFCVGVVVGAAGSHYVQRFYPTIADAIRVKANAIWAKFTTKK